MVRLSRIYTRKGDDGTTQLGNGERVPKDDLRILAYGSADELGAILGMAVTVCTQEPVVASLKQIQNDLFDLGADLCLPAVEGEKDGEVLRVSSDKVDRLEHEIDEMNEALEPLESFVLSGGTPLGAWLHLARCVARRCECEMVALSRTESINAEALRYINRLSDFLFVMARFANKDTDAEVLWKPGGGDDAADG